MERSISIEEVLHSFDLDEEQLLSAIQMNGPDTSILLVGSIVERLSTPTSDIDVIVIFSSDSDIAELGEENEYFAVTIDPNDAAFPMTSSVIVNRRTSSGYKLQIELTTEDRVSKMQDRVVSRMEGVYRRLRGEISSMHRKGTMLVPHEQKLMDRIYTGAVVGQDRALITRLRSKMPYDVFRDQIAIIRATEIDHLTSDLKGITLISPHGEVETKCYIISRLLTYSAGVILAALGETVASEKFFFRLLDRNARLIGEELVAEISQCVCKIYEIASTRPLCILNVVQRSLERAFVTCPILSDEVDMWKKENHFSVGRLQRERE